MLAPPTPLDEIQLNSVYELHDWGVQQHIFGPASWSPLERSKGQISSNCNYKVNFKDFFYQTVCVLTNERFIRQEFSFCHLGHALGVRLGGEKLNNVNLSIMLSPQTIGRNPTTFGVLINHMNEACNSTFFAYPLGPWGGIKMINIIKLQLQTQFQRFLYQTLCVLTIKGYKTYQMEFSFCGLGHAPGVGLWECWGQIF